MWIIDDNGGKRYYFRSNNFVMRPKNIVERQKVKFIAVEGFDVKRNAPSLESVYIRYIKI